MPGEYREGVGLLLDEGKAGGAGVGSRKRAAGSGFPRLGGGLNLVFFIFQ